MDENKRGNHYFKANLKIPNSQIDQKGSKGLTFVIGNPSYGMTLFPKEKVSWSLSSYS